MLLSIIVPFYNSERKCYRLLERLKSISSNDVELILVDDGSSDNTPCLIKKFQEEVSCKAVVILQANKGPGGARNRGLSIATGEYVWFVDSDDDISPLAIEELRLVCGKNYDFVAFDVQAKEGVIDYMNLAPGEYVGDAVRSILFERFGRICSKIIKRSLIEEHNVLYPENCVYEDNPLGMIYPLYVKSFFKSELVGYFHHEEHFSVTRRDKLDDRFFDRLATAEYGAKFVLTRSVSAAEAQKIKSRFKKIYFDNTVLALFRDRGWLSILSIMRVSKSYRVLAAEFAIAENAIAFSYFKSKGRDRFRKKYLNFRLAIMVAWIASYLLASQKKYFLDKHYACWGRNMRVGAPPKLEGISVGSHSVHEEIV